MRWAGILLLACAVLPFATVRDFGHVHDDHDFRGPGTLVTDGRAGLDRLWQADVFGTYEQPSGHSGYWRPLILLSFRAEHWLTGGREVPYAWLGHVVTVLCHGLATLALWRLLLALGVVPGAGFFAAALFAAHPVHAEPVAWLSGRADVLPAALAWAATALLIVRRGAVSDLGAGVLLLTSLLCKESAVVGVALAALLARWGGRSRRAALGVPAAALLAYGLARIASFEGGMAEGVWTGPADASTRWLTWLSVVPDLVRLSVWPGAPATVHPVSAATSWGDPTVVAGLAVLGLLSASAAWCWRVRLVMPLFAFALWMLTLVLLAPWVPLPLGYQELAAPLAERHLYAAAAAPAVLLAWVLASPLGRHPRLALGAGLVAVLVLAPVLAARLRVWSSDEAFARAALARAPRSAAFLNHLGWALMTRAVVDGRVVEASAAAEALEVYSRAAALDPQDSLPELNRFILLAVLDRQDEAAAAAEELLTRFGDQPGVLHNVALWHLREDRPALAAALLTEELQGSGALPGAREALEAARRAMQPGAR